MHGQNAGADRGGGNKEKERGGTNTTAASKQLKVEGGLRGSNKAKAKHLALGQHESHSHVCILPQCGVFCTPNKKIRVGKSDTFYNGLGKTATVL